MGDRNICKLKVRLNLNEKELKSSKTIELIFVAGGHKAYANYNQEENLYILNVEGVKGDLIVKLDKKEIHRVTINPNNTNCFYNIRIAGEDETSIKSEIGTVLSNWKKTDIGVVFDVKNYDSISRNLKRIGFELKSLSSASDCGLISKIKGRNKRQSKWRQVISIRQVPGIYRVGLLDMNSRKGIEKFELFEGIIEVSFTGKTISEEILQVVSSLNLEVKRTNLKHNLLFLEVSNRTSVNVIKLVKTLLGLNDVNSVLPVIYREKKLDAIIPNDFLWNGQWEKRLVEIHNAWQILDDNSLNMFGNPKLLMTIVDMGLATVGGIPQNEEFQGAVSDGGNKVAWTFDFQPSSFGPNNDTINGSHGVGVAGMAAAKANNISPNVAMSYGVAGAAPNIQISGIQFDEYSSLSTFLDTIERYRWMAGLKQYVGQISSIADPMKLSVGPDIIVSSIGSEMYGAATITAISRFSTMLTDLKIYGRKGRGLLMFYSAGNDDLHSDLVNAGNTDIRYSSYDEIFACAASTIDPLGNEVRARYSNYSNSNLHPDKRLIEFCAPSGSLSESDFIMNKRDNVHNPPNSYLTWTTDLVGEGNLPGYNNNSQSTELTADIVEYETFEFLGLALVPESPVTDSLINPAAMYSSVIDVNDASIFKDNQWIKINGPTQEWVRIASRDTVNNKLNLVDPLANDFLTGLPISIDGYPSVSVSGTAGFSINQYISIQQSLGEVKDIIKVLYIDTPNSILVVSEILNPHSSLGFGGFGVFGLVTINVLSTSTLVEGKSVLIGEVEYDGILRKEKSDYEPVLKILNSTQFLVDRIRNGHLSGTKVYVGGLNYRNTFSGTSSAAPLCGGIGALVLTANQDLTWLEVREILRNTAVKIDPDNIGFTVSGPVGGSDGVTGELGLGRWIDENGDYVLNIDGTPNASSTGNRIYSDWYGYGRLDAEKAVEAALAYSQTERDLVIRDSLVDDGTTGNPTDIAVESPDIWVRNIDPGDEVINFATLNYAENGPHLKPMKDADRHIYARIKNIGVVKKNLDAKVRFYLVLSSPGTQFKFPDHFSDYGDVTGGLPGAMLLGEVPLLEGEIDANGVKVVNIPWPKDFTDVNTTLETNILVEITPHDGPYFGSNDDGLLIGNCNNLSRKKVVFREEIEINKQGGTALPISIAIPSDAVASLITTDFEVDIIDTVLLTTEDVKITMTYKLHGNPEEVVEYRYAGGSWGFNTAPSGSWASLNDPLIEPFGVADLALGDKNNIRFKGSFNVDGTVDYVKIKCDYTNINGDVRTDFKTVDIRVEYISDGIEDSEPIESSKAYFFTELPLLIHGQSYPDVFGPDNSTPDTVFRTTNKFWTDVDAKAFAVVSGQILVVPTTNPLIVNVVLKPRNQGSIDFLEVKYFVYRGILKDQLIDSSDDQKVVAAGTNAFVDSIWDTQEKINDAIENADLSDGIGPGSVTDEPSALALGVQYVFPATEPWHVEKLDAESLDQLFFDEASDYKFPIVRAGEEFGKFRNTSIGFDIILNDPSSVTTFAEVRGVENVITVTALGVSPTDLEKLQDRSERAKILEYMDPAAFYGIHYYSGINAYDAGGTDTVFNSKDTNNAYDAIINKFLNKNRTYIDIRNENEYSFNYYDNYTASGADIKLSFDSGVLPTTEVFGTSGWPIRIVENAELESGETGKKNAVYIEFPKGDNTAPLLYKSFASDFKRFPKKPRNKNRFLEVDFDGVNLYSETIKLGLPNREDNGDTTAVSWYMKLNYIKRNLVSNPASAGMVINGQDTFDHLFPVVDNVVWNSSNQILFNAGFQSTFFEKSDFSCFGELGFAKEANRVVFYMTPEEVNFQPSKNMRLYKRVIGGVSNKTSFFEVLKNIFPDFSLQKGELTVGATSKFYLNYEDGTKRRERESDKHNFICVGMTKAEFDALLASATASNIDSDLHTPLLVVKSKSVLADDNGAGFIKYELGVAGLDIAGNYVVAPATVEAYSIDNTMLTSSDFADQETSTDNENPDCIEFIDVNGPERNTVFGQVIKRVSLFKEANGTVTRKWKMYTDSGADLNYENTDVSNFGDPLNNTMQIELPVGVRVIMLECKILPVETLGSVNYIRVVTYYNGDFREGYISENAIKNSTDERTLNTENIEPDEQFDALVNDIKLDTELARRITLDPIYMAETTYPHSVDFTNLLSSLEAELDPSDPSSFITKYQSLSETDKRSWMAGLKSIESYFSFNFYQDALKGFRIDYPATAKKFMNVFSETTMPIKTVKADTSPVNVLFLPLTAEWSGYRAASLEPYGPNLQDFFENKASTLLNEIFGDNGTSYDNGGLGTADDEFTAIIGELKNIRKYLQSMAVDGVVYPLDENVLETKEAKWFLDDAHDDAYLDTITDIIFVWSETWKKDANPNHLKTDFRAGYIGVDCSMGFVNSNNVFVVLAHELNVGDGNVLGLADDTHTYDSNSLIVKNGVNNTKFVSHTSWEYVKENDFQTFNGHGFHPVASYLDAQGKILGREGYSPTKNICDFLQRNPSIGVIYAQYIIGKLKTL